MGLRSLYVLEMVGEGRFLLGLCELFRRNQRFRERRVG